MGKVRGVYAVVVGCGRLGLYLAGALSEGGCSVVVVDIDSSRFLDLGAGFSGFTIEGDAIELATLEQSKTGKADIFIAATGSDSVNLMVSQIARTIYGVKKVATRIYDPALEPQCRRADLLPISTVTTAAVSVLRALGLQE